MPGRVWERGRYHLEHRFVKNGTGEESEWVEHGDLEQSFRRSPVLTGSPTLPSSLQCHPLTVVCGASRHVPQAGRWRRVAAAVPRRRQRRGVGRGGITAVHAGCRCRHVPSALMVVVGASAPSAAPMRICRVAAPTPAPAALLAAPAGGVVVVVVHGRVGVHRRVGRVERGHARVRRRRVHPPAAKVVHRGHAVIHRRARAVATSKLLRAAPLGGLLAPKPETTALQATADLGAAGSGRSETSGAHLRHAGSKATGGAKLRPLHPHRLLVNCGDLVQGIKLNLNAVLGEGIAEVTAGIQDKCSAAGTKRNLQPADH